MTADEKTDFMKDKLRDIGAARLKHVEGGNFVWINIDSPAPEVVRKMPDIYPFHQLDIEDCLSRTQLPKIDEYPDYLFIIVHFPRYLKERRYSVASQVSIFLGRDFLVTIHTGELKPINRLFERCRQDGPSASELLSRSSTFLLYKLLQALAGNLFQMSGKILSNIETIESKVFDEKVEATREVTELRHDIANLRKTVFPLKRVIHDLEKKTERFAAEAGHPGIEVVDYFEALADSIDAVWSTIQECKEIIEIYKDTDYIISSDRTNKILALLTIVFTFSIPATVIGTLYGMNVKLPGGAENALTFFGPYTTFILIVSVSVSSVVAMYLIFKKIRWL